MNILYRYEIEYTSEDGDTKVKLRRYSVVRETEYTYFINPVYYPHKLRRCSKTAFNTFAYDSIEEAKKHFIRRTETRIRWFKFWIEECERALELIKEEAI